MGVDAERELTLPRRAEVAEELAGEVSGPRR